MRVSDICKLLLLGALITLEMLSLTVRVDMRLIAGDALLFVALFVYDFIECCRSNCCSTKIEK